MCQIIPLIFSRVSVGPLEANAKKEGLQGFTGWCVCGGGGRSRGANAGEGKGERKQVLNLAVTHLGSGIGWGLQNKAWPWLKN